MMLRRSIVVRVMGVVLLAGLVGGGVALVIAAAAMTDTADVRMLDQISANTERARLAVIDRMHVAEAQLAAATLLAESGRVDDVPATLSEFVRGARVFRDGETIDLVRSDDVRSMLPSERPQPGQWLAGPYIVTSVGVGAASAIAVVEVASLFPPGRTELRPTTDNRLSIANVIVTRAGDRASSDGALEHAITLHHEESLLAARGEVALAIRRAIGSTVVVTLVVAIGLAWLLARRLTRPIRSLAAAVREGGETFTRPKLDNDEIGALGAAVATMHATLAHDARVLALGAELARSVVRLQAPEAVIAELQKTLSLAHPAQGWEVRVGGDVGRVTLGSRRTLERPVTIRDDNVLAIPLEIDRTEIGMVVGQGPVSDADLRSAEVMCHTALATIRMLTLARAATLNDKLALLGRMSAGIAHEINNPLAFITLNLGLLEDTAHDDAQRELVRETSEGVTRVAQIVKDLSQLSRAGSDEIAVEDLAAIAASQVKIAHARAKSIPLQLSAAQPVWVRCARARIDQAVLNLVANAIDAVASRSGGVVDVEVRSDGDEGVVVVRDNGPGIPKRVQTQLFDAFFTTKGDHGTGLGLYLSRQFVQLQGGKLELAATSDLGTAFEIRLPRAPPPRAAIAPGVASTRRKVLIVDDEPLILKTLERWLAVHVDVVTAANGSDALDRLADGPFSLVLCDWNMPVMSGEAFVAAAADRMPAIRAQIVIMSGGRVDNADGLRVLPKPVPRDTLRELLGI